MALPPSAQAASCPGNLDTTASSKQVLVESDVEGVYVYQAFTAFAAQNAVKNQKFVTGQGFKLNRMSWLKLSFGWMLHRSNYARNHRQEHILRIKISHEFFRSLLESALPAHFEPSLFTDKAIWAQALADADVIYQWDPDRDLRSQPLERSVLQLGLRGKLLATYAERAILEIKDVTPAVRALRDLEAIPDSIDGITRQTPYPVSSELRRSLLL